MPFSFAGDPETPRIAESPNVLYKNKIKVWKKEFDFNITVDECDEKWRGNVCHVPDLLVDGRFGSDSKFLICGPPIMVDYSVKKLNGLGVKDNQIFVSLERHMKCGVGKCGHCQVDNQYICKEGPVYNYSKSKLMHD